VHTRLLVSLDRPVQVTAALLVARVVEQDGAHVQSVTRLAGLKRLVHTALRYVQLVQEVISPTSPVQSLRFVDHTQMHSGGGQSRVRLSQTSRFANGAHAKNVAHVAQANFSDVEAFVSDADGGHAAPGCSRFSHFDCFVPEVLH
jgi:hypothetical protein